MSSAAEHEIEEVGRRLKNLTPGSRVVIHVERPDGVEDLPLPPIICSRLAEFIASANHPKEELTALVRRLEEVDPEVRAQTIERLHELITFLSDRLTQAKLAPARQVSPAQIDAENLAQRLAAHFTRAAQKAVEEHHARGTPVHTEVSGRIVPVPPPPRSS